MTVHQLTFRWRSNSIINLLEIGLIIYGLNVKNHLIKFFEELFFNPILSIIAITGLKYDYLDIFLLAVNTKESIKNDFLY